MTLKILLWASWCEVVAGIACETRLHDIETAIGPFCRYDLNRHRKTTTRVHIPADTVSTAIRKPEVRPGMDKGAGPTFTL